jgi:hypothetical protein
MVKGYHVMVGHDNLIFGAGVPGVGSDGILAGDTRLNSSAKVEVEKSAGEDDKVMSVAVQAELVDPEP